MNQMKYYVDAEGVYLGGWDANPPAGAIEVPTPPADARQVWDGEAWGEVPPQSYRLYKSTLIRRLTEQEAVTLTALLHDSPAKSQMLWAASEWLDSADPLFDNLTEAISVALGEDRAAEILAGE